MKNILIILLFVCPMFMYADPWDNLTMSQAEQVSEFLQSNPFILEYCDCCDYEGEYASKIYLMKVTATEIITCDWDAGFFSVRAQVEVLAQIPYLKEGPDMSSPIVNKSEDNLIITMNYTWAYNKQKGKAAPFYSIIPYDTYGEQELNTGSCRELVAFPKPESIQNEAYEEWYNNQF